MMLQPDDIQVIKTGLITLALLGFGSCMSGCATLAGEGVFTGDNGRILISADAEGMQAFSDMIQGSINNGKQSPDTESAHFGLRREQIRAKALKSWSSFSAAPKAQSAATGAIGASRPSLELGQEYPAK